MGAGWPLSVAGERGGRRPGRRERAGHHPAVGHDLDRALARRLHAPRGARADRSRAARVRKRRSPAGGSIIDGVGRRGRGRASPERILAIAPAARSSGARACSASATAREMPEFSRSSETCMATIPPSISPITQMHARLRSRRSTTRWSGIRAERSNAPVRPRPRDRGRRGDGAARRVRRPGAGRSGRYVGALRWRARACQRSSLSLRAARRRADFDRGLAATSPGVGTIERRWTSSASGVLPQTQTGRSGGQMQPRARSARKRLTRRSSSEWKEIAATRPPIFSDVPGQRERVVELRELAVDGDPDRLEGALGRVAAGEPRGRGDGGGDRVVELEGRGQLGAAAAADDLARDPVGEALLAVLAQRARDPAAVPGVDDLGAPSAPGRGPCACPAARRRRRRSRARGCRPASSSCRGPCRRGPRARPSSISCCRPLTKSARMKRVSQATSAASSANAASAVGSRSIAISVPVGPSRSATSRA